MNIAFNMKNFYMRKFYSILYWHTNDSRRDLHKVQRKDGQVI